MSSTQWVLEEAKLYGTYFRRCQDTRDQEIVAARQGQDGFRHEFFLACEAELRQEEEDRLVSTLRPQYLKLTLQGIRVIVREHLLEEGYPKEWRVLKRMTLRRKENRERSGLVSPLYIPIGYKGHKVNKPLPRKKELRMQKKFIKENGIGVYKASRYKGKV